VSLARDLRTALAASLPSTWRVTGFVPVGTRIDRTTVGAWTTDIAHLEGAPNGHYVQSASVALYTPYQDPEKADDALDADLEVLLDALWQVPDVMFDGGQRTATNDQTMHAWILTVRQGITITQED